MRDLELALVVARLEERVRKLEEALFSQRFFTKDEFNQWTSLCQRAGVPIVGEVE